MSKQNPDPKVNWKPLSSALPLADQPIRRRQDARIAQVVGGERDLRFRRLDLRQTGDVLRRAFVVAHRKLGLRDFRVTDRLVILIGK